MQITPGFSSFLIDGPSSLAKSGGAIYGMGYLLQPFTVSVLL
jgi:hypothetical protein